MDTREGSLQGNVVLKEAMKDRHWIPVPVEERKEKKRFILPWFSERLSKGLIFLDFSYCSGKGRISIRFSGSVHPEVESVGWQWRRSRKRFTVYLQYLLTTGGGGYLNRNNDNVMICVRYLDIEGLIISEDDKSKYFNYVECRYMNCKL